MHKARTQIRSIVDRLTNAPVALWACAAAVTAFLLHLVYLRTTTYFDWDYFNGLSLVSKSLPLTFGSLSFFDPWRCGGIDILANPQSRIASPFFLLDLALPPHVANLFSLVIYAGFGFYGMYVLLQQLEIRRGIAMLGGFLFIHSSWFALHYAEGHIAFGAFQLLPWVVWCYLDFAKPSRLLLFFILMAQFIVDGAFYPFIMSLHIFVIMVACGLVPLKKIYTTCVTRPGLILGITSAWVLVSSFKLAPLLSLHADRPPDLSTADISRYALTIFFKPFVWQADLLGTSLYRYHEYGCYIGILTALLIVGTAVRNVSWLRAQRRWLILAGIFLWIGLGTGGQVNPWTLMSRVPLLNNAHVQSRELIVLYLVIVVLLGTTLQQIKNQRLLSLIMFVLVVEAVIVRNYPAWKTFNVYPRQPVSTLMPFASIKLTSDAHAPELYLDPQTASKSCYEPAQRATDVESISSDVNTYRGEVYTIGGKATVTVEKRYGGVIALRYSDAAPGTFLVVNTNKGLGWRLTTADEHVKIINLSNSTLLVFQVNNSEGQFEAVYAPPYTDWIYLSYCLGVLCFFAIGYRLRHEQRSSSEQQVVV